MPSPQVNGTSSAISEFKNMLLKLLLFITILLEVNGFNIDFKNPIILTDHTEGRSYFGYTTALLTNSAGSWVLVGAPRANSSFDFTQQVVEPGVIHKCFIKTQKCEEIHFHKKVTVSSRPSLTYKEERSRGWLGVSLDVANTEQPNVVACSHLWKNRYHPAWTVNGICYTIDYNLDVNKIRRLLPLIDHGKQYHEQRTHVYSYGMAGFSSQFTQNEDDLILGAPGVYNWTGSVIYTQQSEYDNHINFQRYTIPMPNTGLPQDSYLGYSVSSGAFFKQNYPQLVAGAPRDGLGGSVYIVDLPVPSDRNFIVKTKLIGKQMGEYFGASVCGVDINGDQLSDLLVGAPLHSNEEGLVYFYITNSNSEEEERLAPASNNLAGSSVPGARFGTTISNIGDIDQDGFNDVAIGAPYEGTGGAVYVYRGSKHDLILSQKILASDIDQGLRGFGISISKGKDIDENFYSDIAIGAHDSSHSVVLRSFPVAKLQGSIEFNISKVYLNTPSCQFNGQATACFMLSACVFYSGKHVSPQLDVTNTLTIGVPQRRENRAFFIENGLATDTLKFNSTLVEDSRNCREIETHVLNTTVDYLTPIYFGLKTDLITNPMQDKHFCKSCPVLSHDTTNFVNETLPFSVNCGADEVCDADLRVVARIKELNNDKSFILGSAKTLTLVTEITNKGVDPAYLSNAVILLPPKTHLSRLDSRCFENKGENSQVEIICDLGNPLNPSSKITLDVAVDVSDLKIPVEFLSFTVNASTTSNDVNLQNNFFDLLIPVETNVDMILIGNTDDEQFLLSKKADENDTATESTVINHVFKVVKNGHTPVESITLEMRVPTAQNENNFVEIISADPLLNGQRSHYGGCSGYAPLDLIKSSDLSNSTATEPTTLQETVTVYPSKYKRDTENYLNLDCSSMSCKVIRCRLGPFKDQDLATVTIELKVSVSFLQSIIGDKGGIRFITWGAITINDIEIDQSSSNPRYTEVITEFIKEGFTISKEIAAWIIPLCIIIGILILLLLAFILYKVGFFRRQKKEEMEKLTPPDEKTDNALLDRNGEATDSSTVTETA